MTICDVNCEDIQNNAIAISEIETRLDAIEEGNLAVVAKTNTYTATASDIVIVCNKATAMTINLPAATGSGKFYYIKNINTGTVTVDASGAETIDGEITQELTQWDSMEIIDCATGTWAIV